MMARHINQNGKLIVAIFYNCLSWKLLFNVYYFIFSHLPWWQMPFCLNWQKKQWYQLLPMLIYVLSHLAEVTEVTVRNPHSQEKCVRGW